MYNLLSDKLDRFEREMRKVRNTIVAKVMSGAFRFSQWLFSKFKPYIHTDYLRKFNEMLGAFAVEIDKEMELRKKINAS